MQKMIARELVMRNKLNLLLLGLACTTGLNVGFSDRFSPHLLIQPAAAQSSGENLELEPMTGNKLDAILRAQVPELQGSNGRWQFVVNEIPLIVLADSRANRMRIVAPVAKVRDLEPEQIQSILIANFHTTLDGRYAVNRDSVIATYVHPLDSLQERDLLSALNQVLSLVTTFGTSYSSGELIFAPGAGESQTAPSERTI